MIYAAFRPLPHIANKRLVNLLVDWFIDYELFFFLYQINLLDPRVYRRR